jgi:hypothetical protein
MICHDVDLCDRPYIYRTPNEALCPTAGLVPHKSFARRSGMRPMLELGKRNSRASYHQVGKCRRSPTVFSESYGKQAPQGHVCHDSFHAVFQNNQVNCRFALHSRRDFHPFRMSQRHMKAPRKCGTDFSLNLQMKYAICHTSDEI